MQLYVSCPTRLSSTIQASERQGTAKQFITGISNVGKTIFKPPSCWVVLVKPLLCSEFREMLILKVTISLINLTVSKKRTALHMVTALNSVWYFSGGPPKLASEQVPTCLRVNRK